MHWIASILPFFLATVVIGQTPPLQPAGVIPLRVEGRIDHFSFDLKTHRLFVCALGDNTCQVVDARAAKVIGGIKDLGRPQGVRFLPGPDRLVIADDTGGIVRVFDAATLRPLHRIDLKDDADNVRHDADPNRAWVGYGEGALALIDTSSGKVVKETSVGGHPESFEPERRGSRIFVNVPANHEVAVVDREAGKVVQHWKLSAGGNFPLALDEPHHRLLVVCRQPARMLVLDTQSGQQVAAVDCAGDADDVWLDRAAHRVYISGGEGFVSVIAQQGPDRYRAIAQIPTAPGARTSIFVSAWRKLYVAVPHRGNQPSEIRVFQTSAEK